MIQKSVESLGFKMTDVKILLASHAHADHVAGHALLQKVTGAKVYVMRGDDQVIASGGKGQYMYTISRWAPCGVDRVLEDRDLVKLGGVTLVARLTPGHTRGCTTWTWRVDDGGKKYDVVVIGSPNVNPGFRLVDNKDYPEIAADFARTFEVLKSLPCDVFLGSHGAYYGMVERYNLLKKGQANAFVNPLGYKEYVAQKERAFRTTLAAQQGKAEQRNEKQLRIHSGNEAEKTRTSTPVLSRWADDADEPNPFKGSRFRSQGDAWARHISRPRRRMFELRPGHFPRPERGCIACPSFSPSLSACRPGAGAERQFNPVRSPAGGSGTHP